MIKLRDILKEVGEGTATPYKFKYTPRLFQDERKHIRTYKFTTESNLEYIVILAVNTASEDRYISLSVMFKTEEGDFQDITNKGEQFKIMATVIAIIKDCITKIAEEGKPEVKVIEFVPEKSDDNDTRRANLYKAYIQKQLPNAQVDYRYGEYRITLS
jgi:hypothetical protein